MLLPKPIVYIGKPLPARRAMANSRELRLAVSNPSVSSTIARRASGSAPLRSKTDATSRTVGKSAASTRLSTTRDGSSADATAPLSRRSSVTPTIATRRLHIDLGHRTHDQEAHGDECDGAEQCVP